MYEAQVPFTLNHVVSALNGHADAILRSRFEMTFSQFMFLLALEDGERNLTEVAHGLGVSTAAVSKRTPWFEERGLVRTHADPTHGRKVIVTLTPKGRRLVTKAGETLNVAFVEKVAGLGDLDLQGLEATLNRLLEHLLATPKEGS